MLGENHSLTHEFPEDLDRIRSLIADDESFASDAARYDNLDKEIRELELNGAPIDDDNMHQLKNERAALKDSLYDRIAHPGD